MGGGVGVEAMTGGVLDCCILGGAGEAGVFLTFILAKSTASPAAFLIVITDALLRGTFAQWGEETFV